MIGARGKAVGDRDAWRMLASELGFEFKEGIRAMLESERLWYFVGVNVGGSKDVATAQKLVDHPMIQGLLAKIFLGAVVGKYRGFEFFLFRDRGGSKNRSAPYYVHTAGLFNKDLRCGLEVGPAYALTRLGKRLFPGRYVALPNNPELDRLLRITAQNDSQAKVILADRDIQAQLRALFETSRGVKVTDHGIRWTQQGNTIDKTSALGIMDRIVSAMEKF